MHHVSANCSRTPCFAIPHRKLGSIIVPSGSGKRARRKSVMQKACTVPYRLSQRHTDCQRCKLVFVSCLTRICRVLCHECLDYGLKDAKRGLISAHCGLQMNGMGMGMPSNPIMNQQGMHPHMMGQQPQAPGIAGMMPPQSGSQSVSTYFLSVCQSLEQLDTCKHVSLRDIIM